MKIKHFMDNWEAPHFRERKGTPWGMIITILVVLVLLIALIKIFSNEDIQQNIQQLINPEEEPTEQAVNVVETAPAFVPEFRTDCDVVAGTIPGSLVRDENTVSISFMNNGKKTIEGSYFEFSNDDVKLYTQNNDALAPTEIKTYTVDLTEVGVKLGKRVASFVIIPIQDGKACENQQMVVLSDRADVLVDGQPVAS